jgi:multisubunit Na+/H+ antiporter MnhB subunit
VENVTRTRRERTKRERTAQESLLSIVLGLEAALIFFVTLAIFGLRVLDPIAAFSAGAVLFAAFILAARVQRYSWGSWVGWLMQGVLIATGLIAPVMFFVSAVFIALWSYSFVRGRALDRAKAAMMSEQPTTGSDKS